jgi:hypothetical protein
MVTADADMREAADGGSREAGGGGEGRRWWSQGEEPHSGVVTGSGCGGVGLHDGSIRGRLREWGW